MAESTERALGNDELVYVATTAPTDATDSGDAAYSVVGLQTSFSYQLQSQSTEIRDKRGASTRYGSNTRSGSLGVNTSLVPDDGQTILNNAAESESPKTEVYILITSGVSGERYRAFSGEIGGMNDQSPVDAAATVEYTLAIDGAPAVGFLA